jgi:hypothetical protein
MRRNQIKAILGLLLCLATAPTASAFYNPSTGKWLNRDPIGEVGGINTYAFALNNALDYIDTDGQERGWICSSCQRFVVGPPPCRYCGSGPMPFPSTVDAILVFSASLCVPLDEVGIATAAGWKLLSVGVKRVGQCCCKLLSRITRLETKVDPNKLHHIFDNPKHNLGDIEKAFGGDQSEAFRAIKEATETARKGCGPGKFQMQITIKGKTITVRGTVTADGETQIGTVFQ